MEISLKQWNQNQPRPRCMEQVRRWVRSGVIQPPPRRDGREYLVEAHAEKIDPTNPASYAGKRLMERLYHGTQKKAG
ncbi:excisionase [Candidatus Fukatsuia symbiotica]|uniref:Excisionase n=1 Tax=Candidatus Fukatsuia symbiotica TaxID=1878942 RepID=A0A2U8I5Z3_9GAMM|nr:excisionase [Candidatus Fukatsuia symbiotica]AWK13284.1 excisionase [Candidatus Fukatsuia symbiotica]MEA9444157.1 excisionase [Candidatus Fukatsuia symbiotica]